MTRFVVGKVLDVLKSVAPFVRNDLNVDSAVVKFFGDCCKRAHLLFAVFNIHGAFNAEVEGLCGFFKARHVIGHCLVVIVAECSTDRAVYVNVENRVVIFIRAELKHAVTQPCNILFEQFAVFAELGLNVVDKRMGQNLCALDNHFIRIGVAIVTGLGENINGLVGNGAAVFVRNNFAHHSAGGPCNSVKNRLSQLESAVSSGNLKENDMDAVTREKLHFIKGNCYIELQDYDKAVRELQLAVQQQGAEPESYRSLAIALANAGKLEDAKKTLEILRENGASSGDCDLVAAEIMSLQKQYSEALDLYQKVFDEVDDVQLLSHAYLSAANAALNIDDFVYAEEILEQSCKALPEGQSVLEREMLADISLQQAVTDKEHSEKYYKQAEQRLNELVESGYATISTKLNLATTLQALDKYSEANKILQELSEQYPEDYRFDMQRAYLLIDWQNAKSAEKRNYYEAGACYDSAVEKYRQAQANGTEDMQMAILNNLIDQLRTGGWLK